MPPLLRWWQAADHRKKPVAGRISPEKTGLYIFTCLFCGGAGRRRKIAGLTVPVASAKQIVFSGEQKKVCESNKTSGGDNLTKI
jgi:hypothetical protein